MFKPETGILIEEQGLGGIAIVMDGMQILRKVEDGKAFHKKMTKGKGKGKGSKNTKTSKTTQRDFEDLPHGKDGKTSGKSSRRVQELLYGSSLDDSEDSLQASEVVKPKKPPAPRPRMPLPSRARTSSNDSRPSKRTRQELSDQEDDIDLDTVPVPRVSGYKDKQLQSHSQTQAVATSQNSLPPSVPHYSRQTSIVPTYPPPAPHYSQPSDVQLCHNPSSHHAAQPIPSSRHISPQIDSLSRHSRSRQLTPIAEDHDYYPSAIPRRPPSRGHPSHQYYAPSHRAQPPYHLHQSAQPSSPPTHQTRFSHGGPANHQSRYYSGHGGNGYHPDEAYVPEDAQYDDTYF